jgi:hypothetical protein
MQFPSRALRWLLVITDVGFLGYWGITALHWLPQSLVFKDYDSPVLVAWNWSFFPIDIIASVVGLWSLLQWKRGRASWRPLAFLSLALTSCAGLMAVAFWTLRGDFDPLWWLPNLFLLFWPIPFIAKLISADNHG